MPSVTAGRLPKPLEGAARFARAGFLARGLTYAVVAALSLALAFGIGTPQASSSPQGALALIVSAPLGQVALGIISGAILAFAAWRLSQAVFGRGPEGGGGPSVTDRLANLSAGVVYLVFFAMSISVLTGSTGNGAGQTKHTTAEVLGLPAGEVLCAIAGLVLIGVSLYHTYDAISGHFANDNKVERMSSTERRWFMLVGRIGLIARAVVFSVVGYFLIRAAIELHAGTAVGVNGALGRVDHQFGSWILALIALGLLTFAAFSVFEARYRRL